MKYISFFMLLTFGGLNADSYIPSGPPPLKASAASKLLEDYLHHSGDSKYYIDRLWLMNHTRDKIWVASVAHVDHGHAFYRVGMDRQCSKLRGKELKNILLRLFPHAHQPVETDIVVPTIDIEKRTPKGSDAKTGKHEDVIPYE